MKSQLENCNTLNIENLSMINPSCRFLKHWPGKNILCKITRLCEENNVKVLRVSPTNTSRMCHECKYVDKKNRSNKEFKCIKCKHETNADVNAAKNIRNLTIGEKIVPSDGITRKGVGFYYIKK
jgi:transposase